MLTKKDLTQIQKVVKEELGDYPTKADLEKALSNHPTKADLAKELKPVKQDIAQIRKDVKVIVNLFDREYVELRRRVERIEQHLGITA